jgi:hypothetical protein
MASVIGCKWTARQKVAGEPPTADVIAKHPVLQIHDEIRVESASTLQNHQKARFDINRQKNRD